MKEKTKIRFLDIADTCNTLINYNGVGGEVRIKELKLTIDKPVPSKKKKKNHERRCTTKVTRSIFT